MSLLNFDIASMPLYTSTAVTATGATTLVDAPAAGSRLVIHRLRVYLLTNTTQQVESQFNGALFFSQGLSLGTAPLDLNLDQCPWAMDTATALTFACTLAAASTPTLRVEVLFQRVQR